MTKIIGTLQQKDIIRNVIKGYEEEIEMLNIELINSNNNIDSIKKSMQIFEDKQLERARDILELKNLIGDKVEKEDKVKDNITNIDKGKDE